MEKLKWYLNRLSTMSPIESFHRISNFAFSQYEKLFMYKKKLEIPPLHQIDNLLFSPEDMTFLNEFYSLNLELKDKIIKQADEILNYNISFFSLNNEYLGEKIHWNFDYKNKTHSPMLFYADIDFKDTKKNGDIKYIWELNRFQHIIPLVQAFALTKKFEYVKEIELQIKNWIKENPYLTGVNWTSSLECALRIISWSYALSILDFYGSKLSFDFMNSVEQSIYQHAQYIENHLSKDSSANNHLIGEAAGLIFAGCIFDYGSISKEWIKKGKSILQQEILKQVHEDGFTKEQSFSYQCFIYELFFLSFVLLERYGYEIDYLYWSRLKKMSQAVYFLSDDELNIPDIGDSDDGYVLKTTNLNKKENIRFILNSSSVIFKQRLFKTKAHKIDEKSLWVLGSLGYEQYENLNKVEDKKRSIVMEKSGYAVLKDKNSSVLFDIGDIGYLSIAAHGHADALSVLLNYKNTPFIVDSGTYSYSDELKWLKYFKGSTAHNTLVVDNKNQSLFGGPFMWLKKANVTLEAKELTRHYDYIRASHNGYKKQKIGVVHTREVFLNKNDFLLVVDSIKNTDEKEHSFDLYWHFDEKCEVSELKNAYAVINNDKTIFIETLCDASLNTNILPKDKNTFESWISKKYDSKNLSDTLKANVKSSHDIKIITVIYLDGQMGKAELVDNKLDIFTWRVTEFDLKGNLL